MTAGTGIVDEGQVQAALDIVLTTGRASVASIQRRLELAYTKAADIMDQLEARGIVGPARGSDPREILIKDPAEAKAKAPVALPEHPERKEEKAKAAAKKGPHVEKRKEVRSLQCTLTPEELMTCARQMADAENEIQHLNAEKENFVAQFKSKLSQAEGVVSGKASMIRCGYEFRNVDCEQVKDFDKGTVTVFRLDAGRAVVESRSMTEDEKQMGLALDPVEA